MDNKEIITLLDEYNKLSDSMNAETAGLINQVREIEGQIENIREKYVDRICEIEARLMHLVYISKYNLTETHMYFTLKEAAEKYYSGDENEIDASYYDGVKSIVSQFISDEKMKKIDQDARTKFDRS